MTTDTLDKPQSAKKPGPPRVRDKSRQTKLQTPAAPTPTTTGPIYVIFVLDASSSMYSKAREVRAGFNNYIAKLRADATPADDYRISVITFDHVVHHSSIVRVPLADVMPLDESNYRPDGWTALYDAIGYAIDETTSVIRTPNAHYGADRVLCVVMTDGEENSSKRYTKTVIADKIRHRQDEGNWTFVYLGANQDAWGNAENLGFNPGNVVNYDVNSSAGAFHALSVSTTSYAASGSRSMQDFGQTLDPALLTNNLNGGLHTALGHQGLGSVGAGGIPQFYVGSALPSPMSDIPTPLPGATAAPASTPTRAKRSKKKAEQQA